MKNSNLVVTSTLFIGLFLNAVTFSLLGPTIIKIMSEFNIDFTSAGIILSAWSLGVMTSTFTGKLADKYGAYITTRWSLMAIGLATIALGLSNSIFLLYLFAFLNGIAGGLLESSINQVVLELYQNSQGTMITITHAFFGFGSTLGPSIATFLIYTTKTWRVGYVLSGGLLFFVSLTLFLMKPKYEKEYTTVTKSNKNFSYLFLIPLALGILFDLVIELGTNSWLPTFLIKSNRTNYVEAGIVLSFFWAMFSIGRLISGKIADKYGFTKLLLLFSSLGSLAGLFALLAKGLIVNVLAWGLVGLAIAPTYPIIMAIVYRKFTSSAGSVIGKIVTIGYAGSVLIAPIFGIIDSILGPVYATSLIPLSSIGLMVLFFKMKDTD